MSSLPQRARRSFDADPSSVAQARRFARQQLEEWGAPELADSAALAVSELVTNAVVHTGTTTTVDLRLDTHSLRVEVEDQHPGRALPTGLRAPDDESESGRGLLITSSIASSWGVEYTSSSKRVWLVCDRDRSTAHRPAGPRGCRTRSRSRAPPSPSSSSAPDGTVAAWNSDATRLFGWRPEQVVGRPFHQVVDPVAGQRPPDRGRSGRRASGRASTRCWPATARRCRSSPRTAPSRPTAPQRC